MHFEWSVGGAVVAQPVNWSSISDTRAAGAWGEFGGLERATNNGLHSTQPQNGARKTIELPAHCGGASRQSANPV